MTSQFVAPPLRAGRPGPAPAPVEVDDDCALVLTEERLAEADEEGLRRNDGYRARRHVHRVFDPGEEETLDQNVRAARSELALSVATGLEWTGKGEAGALRADVGDLYEVRAVEGLRRGLIVRNRDPDRPFVLALVSGPRVEFRGWLQASEARTEAFWRAGSSRSPTPYWDVPLDELRPMTVLFPAWLPRIAEARRVRDQGVVFRVGGSVYDADGRWLCWLDEWNSVTTIGGR